MPFMEALNWLPSEESRSFAPLDSRGRLSPHKRLGPHEHRDSILRLHSI